MSNRPPADRTPPSGPSYKTKGTPPHVDLSGPKYGSQPSSAPGSYHNTPSRSLRSPASNESPSGSRPETPTGPPKGLVIPEPQSKRDHSAPRSPLAQSHTAGGHAFNEPSPRSDWQPGVSNGVSPMSSHFPEGHASRQGYLPSPPASSTRPEFNKPSRENLNPQGTAYRGPPPGNTAHLGGPEKPRNVPSGTPTYLGPAPLPSPALSGMVQQERDESDDEAWDLPVVRTVGAHRDTLTRMGPRQTSITANIEDPSKSPLSEFKFSDDDEEALAKAHRSSSPVEFSEMNREHKPLPLMPQKQSSERHTEDRAPEERIPERVASPLVSPPANRAEAGRGICGDWPLVSGQLPGDVVAEQSSRAETPKDEARSNPGVGPLGEPDVRGPTHGSMPESRRPQIDEDPRDIRSPRLEATQSPGRRNQGPMGPMHSQPDPPSVPAFMRPGPPGAYSGPPPESPCGSHQQSSTGTYPGPRSGPAQGNHPRSPPGAYPGPTARNHPRSPPRAYSDSPPESQPRSPPGPHSGPDTGAHGGPRYPPGSMSPGSYRAASGPGRPPMNGPGPDLRSNYGTGPGPGFGPAPSQPWARPQGTTPPPRGPTGTPGPRGPLRPKNEGSRPRPPGPGAPMGPPPERNEFPLPPGHSLLGSPMAPPSGVTGPTNEFPHGGPGSLVGPSPGGMRPPIEPPLPPGTPGIDAKMKPPPIRTRNGTPAPNSALKPRKADLPPPPRGTTPTLRGPPPTAPPSNRAPSPPRGIAKNQIRPQPSAPELDSAVNFPQTPRGPQPEPAPPKFTCPRPAPPSPSPGTARPAHFDNPNWPLPAATSSPPNKALPPAPQNASPRGCDGVAESEWPGKRQNPMTPASPAGWGPMVR